MSSISVRLRGLTGLFLSALILAGAGAAYSQSDPLQAGGMMLSIEGDTARLELPSGRLLALDLPPQAEVTSLALLDRGWIAAGSTARVEGGRLLFLLTGEAEAARPLAPPAGQQGAERRGPVLLAADGTLQGMAWLEGDTDGSLAVRAAAWDGQGWQAPETVSQPGPGSQLALTGAVLADGSWLLAWSAFDGQDDEVVWSRRTADGWSPASRVSGDIGDNQVPDVTPALAAAGQGALLAWSRFDGEGYRLRVARFEDGRWRDERWAAPVHSLYPALTGAPEHLYLIYLEARPRAWSVLELDRAGRTLRRAAALSTLEERPLVTEDAGGLRLRWPAEQREAAAAWEPVP